MAHPKSGRKIRNFLILRELQLRWIGYMVGVSLALTAGLGALVFRYHREAARVVAIRALDPTDAEAQALAAALHAGERTLLVGLIAFAAVLSVVLAAWQLVTTHRVAGPLHYVASEARRVRDGRLAPMRPLRRGDLLLGFVGTFREMHAALRTRAAADVAELRRLADAAERAHQHDLATALRILQETKEAQLKE